VLASRRDVALVLGAAMSDHPFDDAVDVALVGEEHADLDQIVVVVPRCRGLHDIEVGEECQRVEGALQVEQVLRFRAHPHAKRVVPQRRDGHRCSPPRRCGGGRAM
jgi:hypothetical protein